MLIKTIKQKDRYTFSIEWTDGLKSDYRLSALQKHCPCIACRERRHFGEREIFFMSDQVMATSLKSVGRYALKIEFTSGCSKGIYTYSLLRRLGK